MNQEIHPTAIVSADARLGNQVRIGAYSIVEGGVLLGDNCTIMNHAIIRSGVMIGRNSQVFSHAVIGESPQHRGYNGESTTATIGENVILREFVTVHRGTQFGHGDTKIEDNAYIMAYSHVAHDCRVGRNVVMANAVQLAGHTDIGDFATIGGHSAVTQNNKVGRFCYVGGGSLIRKDLPPFLAGKGNEFEVQGINTIGLSRNGFSEESIRRLRKIFRIFFMQKLTVSKAIEKILLDVEDCEESREFLNFVKLSKNGFHR